jgi:hypothetical protein
VSSEAPRKVRTYPVDLNPPKDLPRSAHDPRWKDPSAAARVSLFAYHRSRLEVLSEPLIADFELPEPPKDSDQKIFTLLAPVEAAGLEVEFRGGGFGELHRRYETGRRLNTVANPRALATEVDESIVDFHAQSVTFGADSEGRYFLAGEVGRVFGYPGDRGIVVVRFCAGQRSIGGTSWNGPIDHIGNQRFAVGGRDARLAALFPRLSEVRAQFWLETRVAAQRSTRRQARIA